MNPNEYEVEMLPTDLPKEIPATNQDGKVSENEESVKTLLSWHAPGRPFKKRSKQFYMLSLLISALISIILGFFSQFTLIAVVWSLVFLTFVFSLVPPKNFHYRISTEGITVEDHFYLWKELYDFYFKKVEGVDVLKVRTEALIPGELTITLGEIPEEQVKGVLVKFLPYREVVKKTFLEKSGDYLSANFPLERT